ncbi:MAG: M48 family metallopeptidase [Shewanella sp.]|nr:M48 family metallopeptidase [Shewanella sp.]
MIEVKGTYHLAGKPQHIDAVALVKADHGINVLTSSDNKLLHSYYADEYKASDVIPSLPVELSFTDGAIFTPKDIQFRWPHMAKKQWLAAWLETHWSFVIAATLFVPVFMWVMTTKVLPAAADASVSVLPDSVSQQLGKQTMAILDNIMLDPSEVDAADQMKVNELWLHMLQKLDYSTAKYQLKFRASDVGANAFALADGTVVVTDDLVKLMQTHPDELRAILLHEIGHVEHQHSLKQLARSTAITLLFTLILGDIEGAGEMVIGAGSSLLQASFSRDMESQADSYSHQELTKLGISPAAFGQAIKLLEASHRTDKLEDKSSNTHWLQYLNTHPSNEERIRKSQNE